MVNQIKFQLKNSKIVSESHKSIVKFDNKFNIGYFWNIGTDDKKKKRTFYVIMEQCHVLNVIFI